MDLQNSHYDEELYQRCKDIEMQLQKSNGYSPASQPQYLTCSGNPLWEDEEDIEIDNIEMVPMREDAYEPVICHQSNGYSPASQPQYLTCSGNPLLIEWQDEEDIENDNNIEVMPMREDAYEPVICHQSNGYSPASQPQYLSCSGNPLLIEWQNEEDIEIVNIEVMHMREDAYEPVICHQSNGYSLASQPQYLTYTGNPLLIEWKDEEDIAIDNIETVPMCEDAYEPVLCHKL
ncbi:uncharacterized protein [Choristoneura fumiferana]|uniref:uncharacterized protein n=1 Tax=Choristoneura fumiferana TaxID=7141 RepID=UPI003D155861